MKKILLIEDRPGRQKQFLNDEEIRELSSCVESIDSFRTDIIDPLNSGEGDVSDILLRYDLLIIHRSIIESAGLLRLLGFCRSNNKDLILFSGGITQLNYNKEENQLLILNSADFYSEKLIPFIKHFAKGEITNLLQIAYGDMWELSLLLQYRQDALLLKNEQDAYEKERLSEKIDNIKGLISVDDIDGRIKEVITKL